MHPLRLCSINSWIRHTLLIVWLHDALLVNSLEVMFIMARPVTYDDLARVLIRHDNARNWQPAAMRRRMIRRQFLLHHACVLRVPELVRSVAHRLHL